MAVTFSGGDKLAARLQEIAQRISTAKAVHVGFLAGSTYPDGTSTAMVAATHEFGGKALIPARTVTVYRLANKAGTELLRGGRFVKRNQSNFAADYQSKAHVVVIPARPYFRPMIANNKGSWGSTLAKLLVATNYDASKALGQMGAVMAGQLQQSILTVAGPPLAASTVAKKGNSKLLVDSTHMLASVDFEVASE